ncbi:hypothetical protein I4U23_014076 [Adineta vaga]|nr:hypothetical protein I4U23_014076 [Adineta vaga]
MKIITDNSDFGNNTNADLLDCAESFYCIYDKEYYGYQCQHEKIGIRIDINTTDEAVASVIQFYDILSFPLKLFIQSQQLIRGFPHTILYKHDLIKASIFGILKTCNDIATLKYFILYLIVNNSINLITSIQKQCVHAITLFNASKFVDNLDKSNHIPMVLKYHFVYHRDHELYCLYDADYLCICQPDHLRADCLSHNLLIDQCDRSQVEKSEPDPVGTRIPNRIFPLASD